MTVETAGATAQPIDIPTRLDAYCAAHSFDQPTLVLDVDRVEAQYHALKAGLGHADIQKRKVVTGGFCGVPYLGQRIQRRAPHRGFAGLRADVERKPDGCQAK